MRLFLFTLLSGTLAYAQCTISGTYDLGDGTDGNQATGGPAGPFHLTATRDATTGAPLTFSYVGLIPNQPITFAQLTTLSATFTSNSGGSGGGTPRFSVELNDNGIPRNLHIFLGNSPNFTDSDAVLNGYSNMNLIGNNDPGRYDDSQFAGGSPFTTYANALALVGSLPVLEIFYVTDTFGTGTHFPDRDETLFSINLAGPCPADALQVRYASNLQKGDSIINITNTGSTGNLCVNVYAFDPSEEMIACCACLVTPNALQSISVQGDLIANPISPVTPSAVVIDLVASNATSTCDPAQVGSNLASGLRAWGTTLHALPDATYGVTEEDFLTSPSNPPEITHLSAFCGFIESNGSGFGICKSCRAGGLGGAKR